MSLFEHQVLLVDVSSFLFTTRNQLFPHGASKRSFLTLPILKFMRKKPTDTQSFVQNSKTIAFTI